MVEVVEVAGRPGVRAAGKIQRPKINLERGIGHPVVEIGVIRFATAAQIEPALVCVVFKTGFQLHTLGELFTDRDAAAQGAESGQALVAGIIFWQWFAVNCIAGRVLAGCYRRHIWVIKIGGRLRVIANSGRDSPAGAEGLRPVRFEGMGVYAPVVMGKPVIEVQGCIQWLQIVFVA